MHTTAVSGMLVFMLLFSFSDPFFSFLYLISTLLIMGLVITARNLISGHSTLEILQGLLTGAAGMLMAWWL
jgi:hypothetical protein